MLNFKRKKKIVFACKNHSIVDLYPIVPASDVKFKWLNRVNDEYKAFVKYEKENRLDLEGRSTHLRRCPGIFELMDTGFIVTAPWDLHIETRKDRPGEIRWTAPTTMPDEILKAPPVQTPPASHLPFRPGTLTSVVKLDMPWFIFATPGIRFMVTPIPYPDTFEFEAAHGILDPSESPYVNVNMFWNVVDGKHTIPAGTPRAQLIPLTEDVCNIEVRTINEEEEKYTEKHYYARSKGFVFDKSRIKNLYKRYFKNL